MFRVVAPQDHGPGGSRTTAFVWQLDDGRTVLSASPPPSGGLASGSGAGLLWATERRLPSETALSCPVSVPGGNLVPSKHDFVRVGVVVAVQDSAGRTLLTRRCPHMRTFPQAWVCPGGGVDAGESLPAAAARELREEVGIDLPVASLEPLCMWESVFPTTPEDCQQQGLITGHYLAVFFRARLPPGVEQPSVALQPDEADAALWLPQAHLWACALRGVPRLPDGTISGSREVELEVLWAAKAIEARAEAPAPLGRLRLWELAQCYPSADGRLQGCGEAHLFALRELACEASLEAAEVPRL